MTLYELETARLRLRQFTLDDIDAYYQAIFSDPDVMRYLPGGVPRPKERTEITIRSDQNHWQQHSFGLWAVIYKPEETLIGHCGLMTMPETSEIEVAYALAKPFWGMGLATEAAHASLRFGFETVGLDRIVAVAVSENTASQQVMVKIGMVYEKIAQVYGTELPYYTITRTIFRPGNAPWVHERVVRRHGRDESGVPPTRPTGQRGTRRVLSPRTAHSQDSR